MQNAENSKRKSDRHAFHRPLFGLRHKSIFSQKMKDQIFHTVCGKLICENAAEIFIK